MTDDEPEFWRYCAHCGAELGIDDWPPVVEMVRDDTRTTLHSFCDDECRSGWTAEE